MIIIEYLCKILLYIPIQLSAWLYGDTTQRLCDKIDDPRFTEFMKKMLSEVE